MMSFYTVHSPLQAPDSLIAKYEEKMTEHDYRNPRFVLEQNPDMLSYDSTTWAEKQEWLNRTAFSEGASLPRRTTKVMRRQMTPTFAAMVDYMDHSVGRILGALRRAGLEEETLVVFYSDNGARPLRDARPPPLRPSGPAKGGSTKVAFGYP